MPLVVVKHKAGRILPGMLEKLGQAMPEIVASALDVKENPEAHLTAEDVEVWIRESGPYDINVKDLEIVIWANTYPERLANLSDRKEAILQGLLKFLGDFDRNLSGFVWVLLQPGAFGVIPEI